MTGVSSIGNLRLFVQKFVQISGFSQTLWDSRTKRTGSLVSFDNDSETEKEHRSIVSGSRQRLKITYDPHRR